MDGGISLALALGHGLRPWIRSSPLLNIFYIMALLIGQLAELSESTLVGVNGTKKSEVKK